MARPPPFNKQSQPWPGLATKMDPRPDHGEKSYNGSARLAGRKALITGGDSGMGRAAAIAYSAGGGRRRDQLLPDRRAGCAGSHRADQGGRTQGVAIPGDLRHETFCQRLVEEAVEKLGGLDILVSNAARQQTKRLDHGHFQRGFRRDDEDEHLRAVLDHQGGAAASEAGIGDHRHDVRAGLRSFARPLRLRTDQGRDDELREIAGQATRAQGDSRQRRSAGSGLDAAAGVGRRDAGEIGEFRITTSFGRPGQPAELGSIYVQLAAADASFATGQVYGAAAATASHEAHHGR